MCCCSAAKVVIRLILVVTPLKYTYGLDALAIRSDDPGKYAQELARYVQRWQAQGREVYSGAGAEWRS